MHLSDERGKILKHFGKYTGETFQDRKSRFSPFVGCPHGRGKVYLEDKRGFFLLEGKFEYGNPVEGIMETNIIDDNLISFGTHFRHFYDLVEDKFKYRKSFEIRKATPVEVVKSENHDKQTILPELFKDVKATFKFKGKWVKQSVQEYMQAPQTSMTVNLPKYLPRTYLTEFQEGEVYDFFGNYYSGSFKSKQRWRPDGYGVMELCNGYKLEGNFLAKSSDSDYFEGTMTMPNGKKVEIKDARPITEQFKDTFWYWVDKI